MPAHSTAIQYGCLTKTHFVYAHKLGKEAIHSLYDTKTVRIRWKANDAEGNSITAKGPLCVVYDAALLSDAEALAIFMRDDNARASDDEVQAYGRVDSLSGR